MTPDERRAVIIVAAFALALLIGGILIGFQRR